MCSDFSPFSTPTSFSSPPLPDHPEPRGVKPWARRQQGSNCGERKSQPHASARARCCSGYIDPAALSPRRLVWPRNAAVYPGTYFRTYFQNFQNFRTILICYILSFTSLPPPGLTALRPQSFAARFQRSQQKAKKKSQHAALIGRP